MKKAMQSSILAGILLVGLSILGTACKKEKDPVVLTPAERLVGTWDVTSVKDEDDVELLIPGQYSMVMTYEAYQGVSGHFTWTQTETGQAPDITSDQYTLTDNGTVLTLFTPSGHNGVLSVQVLNEQKLILTNGLKTFEAQRR